MARNRHTWLTGCIAALVGCVSIVLLVVYFKVPPDVEKNVVETVVRELGAEGSEIRATESQVVARVRLSGTKCEELMRGNVKSLVAGPYTLNLDEVTTGDRDNRVVDYWLAEGTQRVMMIGTDSQLSEILVVRMKPRAGILKRVGDLISDWTRPAR